MCENFRKFIVRKNCKIGAVDCDKLDKLFIKHLEGEKKNLTHV
jgi:hypothetical protein